MVASSLSVVRTRLCIQATSSSFRSSLAPGGRLTGSSPSRVRAEIHYVSRSAFSHPSVLIIEVDVGGKSVSLPSGNLAAIDTGTTLIGGPSDAVAAVYAQIPGSQQLSGSLSGFYGFRVFVLLLADPDPDIPSSL